MVSGDPHGIQDCDRSGGETVCIVRTALGKEMLDISSDLKHIAIRNIEPERAFDGQKISDRCKQWNRYIDLFSAAERKVPEYSQFLKSKSIPTLPTDNLNCDKLLKLSLDIQNLKNRNALSQGVPTIATGWSHKYQELYSDYQFLEGYLPLSKTDDDLDMKFNQILLSKREEILSKIQASAEKQKSLAENMWQEIFKLV